MYYGGLAGRPRTLLGAQLFQNLKSKRHVAKHSESILAF
jgi:hypothetical protein